MRILFFSVISCVNYIGELFFIFLSTRNHTNYLVWQVVWVFSTLQEDHGNRLFWSTPFLTRPPNYASRLTTVRPPSLLPLFSKPPPAPRALYRGSLWVKSALIWSTIVFFLIPSSKFQSKVKGYSSAPFHLSGQTGIKNTRNYTPPLMGFMGY